MNLWGWQFAPGDGRQQLVVLSLMLYGLLFSACAQNGQVQPTMAALAASPAPTTRPTRFVPTTPPQPGSATVMTPVASPLPATLALQLSPTPEPVYRAYEVQSGDDAWTIAAKHDVTLEALLAANGLSGDDPLLPGQQLRVPPPEDSGAPATVRYQVRDGDTFSSIASDFGILPRTLRQANPDVEADLLQVGQVLRVPWDGMHVVGPGETLLSIAYDYGVGFDALVQANKDVLDFNSLHHVEAGWVLQIPDGSGVVTDCEAQAPRETVIEYVVAEGEGLFCLAQKFDLSPPTIINANPHIIGQGGLFEGNRLLIPPRDGALYVLSEEDVARGVKLDDIVRWYSAYGPLTDVVDWAGNPVVAPMQAGQALFIPDADTLAGMFDSSYLVVATATPEAPETPAVTAVAGAGAAVDEGAAGAVTQPPASGATFSGPRAWPWDEAVGRNDPGYCPFLLGSGWSGALVWPTASRDIHEERGFRPGHEGIDIDTPENSPVYAAEGGVVIWAGYSSFGGGIIVKLAHGDYWHTNYVHLNDVAVSCGQQVSQGTLIGTSGSTGTSWPHLHFAVYNESTAYDPAQYLP